MTVALDLEAYLKARIDTTKIGVGKVGVDAWLLSMIGPEGVTVPFCYMAWRTSPEPGNHLLVFSAILGTASPEHRQSLEEVYCVIDAGEELLLSLGECATVMRTELELEYIRADNPRLCSDFLADFNGAFKHVCRSLTTVVGALEELSAQH